jgi:hypothetical protein
MFPGVEPTPELILRYALERVDQFSEVVVVALLNDETGQVRCGWSTMPFGTLTFMQKILDMEITERIVEVAREDEDDGGE